jgi:hypothetical protein
MSHHAPEDIDEGACTRCSSAVARIYALIARGEFVEARALIAESTAAGLLSKPHASRLLHRITQLNTKLGEIPARLQRAKDFPSQLKEAAKLIKEQTRLMEKL